MADVLKSCSLQNGLAFSPTVQEAVGHVVGLKLSTEDFTGASKSYFEVRNPAENKKDSKVNVNGVIEEFHWVGGLHTKPVSIVCHVPLAVRTKVLNMIHTGMEDITVEVQWDIYEYDKENKCWYKSCHTNDAKLKGKISVIGGERQLEMSENAGYQVQDPENFRLGMRIIPQGEQDIQLATSNSDKFAKQWGVE